MTPEDTATDHANQPPRLRLRGRRWGEDGGHTFVLLHGLGVASRMTVPLGARLAPHGTVLAPDLPGFGAEASAEERAIPELGALVADRLDGWPRPVTLLGCSMGAQVAIHAAAALGDRLHTLVLASPTVDRHRRTLPRQLVRWPLELATQPAALVRIQTQDHRAAGMGRIARTLRSALDDRPEAHASRIRVPTLVVHGSRDPLVGHRWAAELARTIADARLVRLRARHAMTFTEPQPLADAVLGFVDAHRGDRPARSGATSHPHPP